MNELQVFNNDIFGQVRTIFVDDKPYFCGNDIATALGYKTPRHAISTHCPHVLKRAIGVQTGTRPNGAPIIQDVETAFIPEGDVYRLIIRSKLPSAEQFEHWLFDEVLPQIRRTGGYIPVSDKDTNEQILSKALLIAQNTIEQKDVLLHRQTLQIEEMRPKVKGYDTFLKSQGYVSLNKVAKSLHKGRNRMMKFLREQGILFKDGNDNIAYQRFCNAGYFTVDYKIGRDGMVHAVTKVSPKGIDYIKRLYERFDLKDIA